MFKTNFLMVCIIYLLGGQASHRASACACRESHVHCERSWRPLKQQEPDLGESASGRSSAGQMISCCSFVLLAPCLVFVRLSRQLSERVRLVLLAGIREEDAVAQEQQEEREEDEVTIEENDRLHA